MVSKPTQDKPSGSTVNPNAPPTPTADKCRLPTTGEQVVSGKHTYALQTQLGDGGYGVVFQTRDNKYRRCAIKVEKLSKSMLSIELDVLRSALAAKAKHFLEPIDHGVNRPHYAFIVMPLLNKDLHKLRNEQHNRKYTKSTAIRIGMQTMECIRELHGLGYVSRDIKPSNFAPGLKDQNRQHKTIFIFDFGLARKHKDKNGNLLPARKDVGWRGTSRYGSLEAHRRKDLGRRDDIESWFYMLIEVYKGALPWRLVVDRQNVFVAKMAARDSGRATLLGECPKCFDGFLTKVDSLVFETDPPYDYFLGELKALCKELNISKNDHWDWDDEQSCSTSEINSTTDYSDRDPNNNQKKDDEKDQGSERDVQMTQEMDGSKLDPLP